MQNFNRILKSQIHKNLVRNFFMFGLHLASFVTKKIPVEYLLILFNIPVNVIYYMFGG